MQIRFKWGCRRCWQSDGVWNIYTFIHKESSEYKTKTEYDVMVELEKIRKEDGDVCEFCGSSNVSIEDIQINDEPLYDFDRLVQACKETGNYILIFHIDKTESNISTKLGGSSRYPKDFVLNSFSTITDIVGSRGDDYFASHNKGKFQIIIYGNQSHLSVERMKYAGITKEEVRESLKKLSIQLL